MKVEAEAIHADSTEELHLFLLESPRPWWSLVASVAGHAGAVAVVVLAARFILPEDPNVLYRRVRVDPVPMIEVRVPKQMFLRSPQPKIETPNPKPGETGSRPRLTLAALPAPAPAPNKDRSPAPQMHRRFELPPTVRRVQTQQTILQIDPPEVESATQTRLPELVSWNASDRIKVPPKKFVAPGQKIPAPANPAMLDAPPVLAAPNSEVRVTGIKMTPVRAVNPNILISPSTTMPMRSLEIQAPPQLTSNASPFPGQPANLIITNPNPAPLTPEISVPSVVQLGAMPIQSGTGAGTGAGSGPVRGSTTAGSGLERNPGAKGEGGMPGPPTPGNPAATSGAGSREGARLGTGTAAVSSVAPPIRIFHPDNGVYDVVVTRSSATDLLPGVTGLLTGQTVYMVYLNVGANKEWILQYCDTKSSARQTGSVISLGSPVPVKAPYPRKTIIPPAVVMKNRSRAVFQGFLDPSGQFRDLKLVGQEEAELAGVLVPYLRQWEFRPATRDGKAVEIEVLLAVPPSAN